MGAVAAGYGELNLEESARWGSRNIDCFQKLEQIGEGTYGYVSICVSSRVAFYILWLGWIYYIMCVCVCDCGYSLPLSVRCTWPEIIKQERLLLSRKSAWTMRKKGYLFTLNIIYMLLVVSTYLSYISYYSVSSSFLSLQSVKLRYWRSCSMKTS